VSARRATAQGAGRWGEARAGAPARSRRSSTGPGPAQAIASPGAAAVPTARTVS
jgi:hypothetical protein